MSSTDLVPNACPRCGNEKSAAALDGLCPTCLFSLAADSSAAPVETPASEHAPAFTGTDAMVAAAPTAASPQLERVRQLFPELEIERTLGQGGMGIVYLARQKHLDRFVALKIISPEIAGDATFAERFSREARTTAKLSHSNIAMVFDFGEVDGTYYMIMEYIEGQSLRQLAEDKWLGVDASVEIIREICDALGYAHQMGVVHRDMKPENVIVTASGNVKVVDFGLAKLMHPSHHDLTLTATRQVMGTPRYMSPEQMDSPQLVDHRSDIYSVGVIFHELLTGEIPTGNFDPPSQKRGGNSRLDDLVMRALSKDPARRFQAIAELQIAMNGVPKTPPVPPRGPSPIAWPRDDAEQLQWVGRCLLFAAGVQWFFMVVLVLCLLNKPWGIYLPTFASAGVASGLFTFGITLHATTPGVGMEAASIAAATEAGLAPVNYGTHPGVAAKLNRASFTVPYVHKGRKFEIDRGVYNFIVAAAILIWLAMIIPFGFYIRRAFRNCWVGPGIELPTTQFEFPGRLESPRIPPVAKLKP